MTRRRLLLGLALLTALAILTWWLWRWWLIPRPPLVALEGVEPAVAEVISQAREDVRRRGRSAEAWGHLGMVLRAHGFEPASNDCFRQAEMLEPGNPRWPYFRGLSLLRTTPEQAVPLLQQAVRLTDVSVPENLTPGLQLAELLLQLDRLDEAEEQLDHCRRLQPSNGRLNYLLGLLALARNDPARSMPYLQEAASSPSCRKRAFAQLATAARLLGKEQEAGNYAQEAANSPADPPWPDPFVTEYLQLTAGRHGQFAQVERLQGRQRNQEALQILSRMVRETPDDRSYAALGILLAQTGNLTEAEKALTEALARNPEKIQAYYFLALCQYTQAESLADKDPMQARMGYERVEGYTRELLERKADHAYGWIYRGLALWRLDRRDEAVMCLRQGLRCRPELVDAHLHLGRLLVEMGQRDEGLALLREAVELSGPPDGRARQALEQALASKSQR